MTNKHLKQWNKLQQTDTLLVVSICYGLVAAVAVAVVVAAVVAVAAVVVVV